MSIPTISPYAIPAAPSAAVAPWSLQPSRAALLIHDMQNYFLAAYDRNQDPAATAIASIRRLVDAADALGMPVLYSAQPPAQSPARRGLLNDVWGPGIQTAEEAAIIEPLAPGPDHHVLTKWRYSAFERTDLRQILAFTRRDQLIITGVYGHIGCAVTAADAYMNDVQPFFISDAIADFSAKDHAAGMDWVSRRAGVVIDTATAVDQLASASEVTGR